MAGSSAPEGTIALLFTDIEGSTRLASVLGALWPDVLERHDALLRDAIEEGGGYVAGVEGDAFFAAFSSAAAAAKAAVAALRGLRSRPWPAGVGELRVRMGLHVGYVERSSTGYVGLEIHRAARVAAAAHGGQLLMTAAARALVDDVVAVEPLGLHRLKDFPVPESLFCAVVDGGVAVVPSPRTETVRPTNLPAGLPGLIGREAEIQRVREAFLVDGERLVTLTGLGGPARPVLRWLARRACSMSIPAGSGWLGWRASRRPMTCCQRSRARSAENAMSTTRQVSHSCAASRTGKDIGDPR